VLCWMLGSPGLAGVTTNGLVLFPTVVRAFTGEFLIRGCQRAAEIPSFLSLVGCVAPDILTTIRIAAVVMRTETLVRVLARIYRLWIPSVIERPLLTCVS